MFRTPYLNPAFYHNALKTKEKGLLEVEQSSEFLGSSPIGGVSGTPVEPLVQLLMFFEGQSATNIADFSILEDS